MTPTTIYQSSKGPKLIADLPYPYLLNARDKLVREQPERKGEIDAMTARIEAEAHTNEGGDEGAATVAVPAPAGHNNPPEPIEPVAMAATADPFEAHRVHIDDLYTEAKNWADGQDIENDEQAAQVNRLIDDFKAAIRAAEASRDEEKRPHQEKVEAIQERYYPLVFDGKTKPKGLAVRAVAALLAVKTKWMNKVEAERRAEAAAAAKIAADLAAKAVQASREAVGNIEATETAEDLIQQARGALKTAAQIAKPVAGTGMRDNWVVTGFQGVEDPATGAVTDGRVLMFRHYWATDRDAMVDFLLGLARRDIRDGKRAIPGLVIENQRKAA